MIETIVIDYLNGSGIRAYAEEPERATPPYVVVEKTGSSRYEHLDRATLAIKSYGDKLINAALLNDDVKRAMLRMPANDHKVTRCDLNSDYNYTNTSTKQYRYQAVFDVTFYEEY